MKYHFLLLLVLLCGCSSQSQSDNNIVVKKDSVKPQVIVHDTVCKYDVKIDYKVMSNSGDSSNHNKVWIYFIKYGDSVTIYVNHRIKKTMWMSANADVDALGMYDAGNADTIKTVAIQVRDGRIAEIEINKGRRFIGVSFLNKILSVEFYSGRQMAD